MDLFEKTLHYQDKLTWVDFLTGITAKHNSQDIENALLAGTSYDSAISESAMLQKWKAPWLFFRTLIFGLVFTIILILVAIVMPSIALLLLQIMFGSCVVPFSLMVFSGK